METNKNSRVNRTISVIHRLSHMYFDRQLEAYHIGSGQQFFLYHIYHHPGCSLWEVARDGSYDKGTTTRAVRKLEEEGYIQRIISVEDKRYHQLYITELAKPLIPIIEKTMLDWNQILMQGVQEDQQAKLLDIMDQLEKNATSTVRKDRKKESE